MKLLAVDTALEALAVALLTREGDRVDVVAETEIIGRGHAERLIGAIEALLDRAGTTLAEIDAFAATVGPGSFTGIRIGVAAVRGFALAAHKPSVGVPTLEALAAEGRALRPGRAVLAALDARKDEVYAQGFDADGHALGRAEVSSPVRVAEASITAEAVLIGTGAPLVAAHAPALEVLAAPTVPGIETIARLALARLDACGACVKPSPLYVRPADAKPQDGARLARLTPEALLGGGTR
ncbi:MAG: tRNA (adenosine(37)-N6)-threonylcarbamoyltransferase complex dimerization subunit type 1 TsaB [Phyllobacteriaceae bacterium]|nr:tRNA (adenosine(37)-N6)-threonylcarbamoyltransferase complex dimerization subunit type 1 TsaB [Phyllobacteriaceae bacterium]